MTVSRSGTARLLSLSVAAVLVAAQLLFMAPRLVLQHRDAMVALASVEEARVQSAVRYSRLAELDLAGQLLSERLVGIRFLDPAGGVLFSRGEVLGDSGQSGPLDDSSAEPIGNPPVHVNSVGRYQTASWTFDTEDGPVRVDGILDAFGVWMQTALSAVVTLAMVLCTALAGALVTMLGLVRFYFQPLDELIETLRVGRQAGQGAMPEPIQFGGADHLRPLAEAFNDLIEEQRKAARQVKVKQQYLEFAAHHDPLTHLPNRLMFEDTLKGTVSAAMRDKLQFAVFLVDLDNFKFFNDQYGHIVGDKMVAEVGNRLRTMMRDIDLVARLDGDEFVVIQKDVRDRASAEEVAERLMSVATAPYEYRGFTLKAAVSVGISCFPDDVHKDQDVEMLGEEIVNNAAVALQEAKSNGKNQYQLFNEQMRSRLTARIRLEQDLKTALAEDQFLVYYQPKINIRTREVVGAEALVRWRHPAKGFISPEVFVPVAEEAGMIIELGEWILRTACRQTHELHQLGYEYLNVAVNISAVQFTDGNLLPMVQQALSDTELTPELLELEITESAVMHDPEEVIRSLRELSRFGMRLAIDDFGTGYSSLAYLKRFSVNTLKIDRAFITDISNDNDDVAIVEAVLGLGKHFNMKVVAEGVEDEEQLRFLRESGCDLAQGYYISRPMSLDDYKAWLKRWPYGVHRGALSDSDNVVPLVARGMASG